jgi:catechol 2,3-dioxygenase-like lactoylglutathione lyase family enzyme
MTKMMRSILMALAAALLIQAPVEAQGPPEAVLKRIRMVTVATPDVARARDWYAKWLDYKPAGAGKISERMAAQWGLLAMAGREYVLMQPASGEDVYLRIAAIDPPARPAPLISPGWTAIEIGVADVDASYARLKDSGAEVLAGPEGIGVGAIRAFQIKGPAGEVLYMTGNTGDRLKSNHPELKGAIDRPFIMVMGGPDRAAIKAFYRELFRLGDQGDLSLTVRILNNALKRPAETRTELSVLVMSERGNKIEIDQFPPDLPERPKAMGQFPPGIAMVSFSVADLSALPASWRAMPDTTYGDNMAGTLSGPAGELIELIADRK